MPGQGRTIFPGKGKLDWRVIDSAGPASNQPALTEPASQTFEATAPRFYITARQPLSPGAILLAIVAAVVALSAVLFVMSHNTSTLTANQKDADDPDQVDVIVIGDPGHARPQNHQEAHVSTVHPTILVHLPRFGAQVGFIPNTPAGHLLYDWLAAFNQGKAAALAQALPSAAPGAVSAAEVELRRRTGGLSLLSAKEVQSGLLVFRLRDQTPGGTEFLGTLQLSPNPGPASIESFSLQAVPVPAPATTKQNP